MRLGGVHAVAILIILSILSSCGGNAAPAPSGNSTANTPPASTPPSTPPASTPPGNPPGSGSGGGSASPSSAGADLIYATNENSQGSVSGWTFDESSSKAAAAPGSPFQADLAPAAMTASADKKFLFVVDSEQPLAVRGSNCDGSNTEVISYKIDHGTGSLKLVQRLNLSSYCGWGVAIDPTGHYLYVPGQAFYTDDSDVSEIAVDGTGHMKEIAGSPFVIPGKHWPQTMAMAPDGKHLYVTVAVDGDAVGVEILSRDTTTGALAFQSDVTSGPQISIAISMSGTTMATAAYSVPQVLLYAVDPGSGAVTPGDTLTVAANHVREVAIDPKGQYLAAATDAGVFMYAITGPGKATAVAGSPFGGDAFSVAFNSTGNFLSVLAPNNGSTSNPNGDEYVSVWKVDPKTGALTQVASGMETQPYPQHVLMLSK